MPPIPLPGPDPLPLPLPPGALKALLTATFALHLLAVNLAVGGGLLLAVHALRGRPEDRDLVRRLAPALPPSLTAAITLGVAPLLFLQLLYGQFFYTATVLTAFPWLALLAFLMGGYVWLYRFAGAGEAGETQAAAGLLASVLLLAAGFSLVNATTLSLRPDLWAAHAAASPRGLRLNLADATLIPRFLHMGVGFVAVAGLLLAAWGAWAGQAFARRAGLRWFALATATQLLWGGWLLMAQPAPLRELLMDGHSPASLSLWISSGLGALACFMALPAGQPGAPARSAWPPVVLGLASTLGMILLRDQLRDAALAGFGFRVAALPHRTDGVSLVVFAATLAAMAVLLVLAVRWSTRPASDPEVL